MIFWPCLLAAAGTEFIMKNLVEDMYKQWVILMPQTSKHYTKCCPYICLGLVLPLSL